MPRYAHSEQQSRTRGERSPLLLPVRRDTPEILLAGTASGVSSVLPGVSDALSAAYASLCTSALFGAEPLTLMGLSLSHRLQFSANPAVNVTPAATVNRQGRLLLYTGAAGAEIGPFAEIRYGEAINYRITGITLDTIALVVSGLTNHFAPIAPKMLPANTRLTMKAANFDASAATAIGVMAVAYNSAQLALQQRVINYDTSFRGDGIAYTDFTDRLEFTQDSDGTTFHNSSWNTNTINGNAVADADYIVKAVFFYPVGILNPIRQFDVAALPAGGTAGVDERIQSKYGGSGGGGSTGTARYEFPIPFLLYKGETLRTRSRQSDTQTDPTTEISSVMYELWRID